MKYQGVKYRRRILNMEAQDRKIGASAGTDDVFVYFEGRQTLGARRSFEAGGVYGFFE